MRKLWTVVGVLVFLTLLSCLGIDLPPVVIFFHLLGGWVGYLARVVPQTHVSVAGVVTAVVCLLGVLFLGHIIARWFWRETAGAAPGQHAWRPAWTASLATIIVLMFVSGIAAVGVVHQSYWLAKSDQPMFGYRGRERANRVKCANNMKQIGLAMLEYAKAHGGKFPDSLEELALEADVISEVFICPSSNDERAEGQTAAQWVPKLRDGCCSYVYHGRGLTDSIPATQPILCEPLPNHQFQGMNVLFGDLHVEFLTPAEAQRVLEGIEAPGQ